MKETNGKNCEECNKPLVKQQQRFCSYGCRNLSHKKYKHSKETKNKISKSLKGRVVSEETGNKISKAKKGKKFSEKHKKKLSLVKIGKLSNKKGKKLSEETIIKMKKSLKGRKVWSKGKKFSEEHKKKLSDSAKERIKQRGNFNFIPNYNQKACEYFKKFDEKNNTKGRFAFYGDGEFCIQKIGYWPDYINFNLKLIMEWDETHHYNKKGLLREKDLIRQKEIKEFYPDFEFRRILEDSN